MKFTEIHPSLASCCKAVFQGSVNGEPTVGLSSRGGFTLRENKWPSKGRGKSVKNLEIRR